MKTIIKAVLLTLVTTSPLAKAEQGFSIDLKKTEKTAQQFKSGYLVMDSFNDINGVNAYLQTEDDVKVYLMIPANLIRKAHELENERVIVTGSFLQQLSKNRQQGFLNLQSVFRVSRIMIARQAANSNYLYF